MKSHGLKLAILLSMQRMPKLKSQDLHSNHRFIMEIESLGLASHIFSWRETVVWIKSLDPTSNLPRLKSLERFEDFSSRLQPRGLSQACQRAMR